MLVYGNYNNDINGEVNFCALPKKYKEVDKYLVRGPHPGIRDIFQLKKEGVTQIYDFRHYGMRGFKFVEKFACKVAGINYKRKSFSFLEGTYPTKRDYETIARSVKKNGEKGGKTVFHCNSGTHRTSLMSAYYRITKGEPLEKVKQSPYYSANVAKIVKEEIKDANYFTRNKLKTNVKNPIVRVINMFNNNVQNVTQKAYDLFVDILKK